MLLDARESRHSSRLAYPAYSQNGLSRTRCGGSSGGLGLAHRLIQYSETGWGRGFRVARFGFSIGCASNGSTATDPVAGHLVPDAFS